MKSRKREEKTFLWKRGRYRRNRFPEFKDWCPGHLWAPGCYHGSGGQGWEVMEKYISGQKGYDEIEGVRGGSEKTGVMPVVVRSEEKAKTHKTWYITLYETLFGGKWQQESIRSKTEEDNGKAGSGCEDVWVHQSAI